MRSPNPTTRIDEDTDQLKVTVTPEWLRRHDSSKNVLVLDARSTSAYRRSHIPGAVHADLFHYFVLGTDPKGLLKFHSELAKKLGDLGLTGRETIVVYETGFGMRASRVAWMLEYAGARRVFLLEGGYRGWQKSRYPTETRASKPRSKAFRIKPVRKILATADQVRSNRSLSVLDVRSEGEFRGVEGRECDSRLGRIPRAKWIEWTNFVKDGRRFKTTSEIAEALKIAGPSKKRALVTYCHRGARAAAAYYGLRSLGYSNVRNYIGSWHEWSARKSLPVEK